MMRIKQTLIVLFVGILVPLQSSAQRTAEMPHFEHRPYFKITPLPRGFDQDSITQVMNYLVDKPATKWTYNDSLAHMYTLISISDYDKSFALFNRLKPNNNLTEDQYHVIQHLLLYKRRYSEYNLWLKKEQDTYPNKSQVNTIRKRIADVNRKLSKSEWSLNDSVVFYELKELVHQKSSFKKGSSDFLAVIVPLALLYDEALRTESKFESNYNRSLSLAFVEFGDYLYEFIGFSDAYICYSIARYYDRYNNDLAVKLRAIKNEMNNKNILFPSIRETFPKQSKGLFNFKKIMEKRRKQEAVLHQENQVPLQINLIDKKDPVLKGYWDDMVLLIGLILLLLAVIIFVRVKKR